MDKTPQSERSTFKGIPPTTESLQEQTLFSVTGIQEERLIHEIERLSHSEEILTPNRVPIHFFEGTGYAGTFPTSPEQMYWPGPRGGAFIWVSCGLDEEGGYMQSKQKVKLHRLELQIPAVGGKSLVEEETAFALYSCREVQLQGSSPTFGFFKKLLSSPRKTLIHPISTLSGLETQKRSSLAILSDFPFGILGGRDPRPVIWNSLAGRALEFDPKSLKPRAEQNLLREGGDAVSKEPLHDQSSGIKLILQRRDGIGSDPRYSQYRLIALIPNMPRIATFMAPRSLSLNLMASDAKWVICSAIFAERRLFYLINRQEGRLMTVYQSSIAGIKELVRLKSLSNGLTIEMIVLMSDGSLRRYLFPRIDVEVAKFDGAAGLLTTFPVCEFETVNDGPFDQIHPITGGFLSRHGPLITKLSEKYSVDQTTSLSPQRLHDFALFPMTHDGQVCVSVIGVDPYIGRVTMNLIDSADLTPIARIPLGSQEASKQLILVTPIYIPTRL